MPRIATTTISDKKFPIDNNGLIDHYVADITSVSDYYPFGSPMDGRTFGSEKYRYSFNTQEKVDEVYGKGNLNTALFWEYDTRLGRRWNLDPKPNPSISDYACFANSPLINTDEKGDTLRKGNDMLLDFGGDFKISTYKVTMHALKSTSSGKQLFDKLNNHKDDFTVNFNKLEGEAGEFKMQDKGKFVINVDLRSPQFQSLGVNAYGVFLEEAFHAESFLNGDFGFKLINKEWFLVAFDIYDEIYAKRSAISVYGSKNVSKYYRMPNIQPNINTQFGFILNNFDENVVHFLTEGWTYLNNFQIHGAYKNVSRDKSEFNSKGEEYYGYPQK